MKTSNIDIIPKKLYNIFLLNLIELNGGMDSNYIRSKRINDLSNIITRYINKRKPLNINWIKEYNKLINYG